VGPARRINAGRVLARSSPARRRRISRPFRLTMRSSRDLQQDSLLDAPGSPRSSRPERRGAARRDRRRRLHPALVRRTTSSLARRPDGLVRAREPNRDRPAAPRRARHHERRPRAARQARGGRTRARRLARIEGRNGGEHGTRTRASSQTPALGLRLAASMRMMTASVIILDRGGQGSTSSSSLFDEGDGRRRRPQCPGLLAGRGIANARLGLAPVVLPAPIVSSPTPSGSSINTRRGEEASGGALLSSTWLRGRPGARSVVAGR
jgi:hypothetical protein